MNRILTFTFLVLISSCSHKEVEYNSSIETLKQFSDLQSMMDAEKDKVLIVNFWATTCPPCIKEMPHFNKLNEESRNKNLKILLVSLDAVKDLDSRVYPFVDKHKIVPEVAVLEDQNYSAWTDKVDESWYGALPATLIVKGDKRKFRFGLYETYEDLQGDVDEFLN